MVRANIKNAEGVYIGLIDEVSGCFRIIWNRNLDLYPEYDRTGSDQLFKTLEEARRCARKVAHDAIISETIFFRTR